MADLENKKSKRKAKKNQKSEAEASSAAAAPAEGLYSRLKDIEWAAHGQALDFLSDEGDTDAARVVSAAAPDVAEGVSADPEEVLDATEAVEAAPLEEAQDSPMEIAVRAYDEISIDLGLEDEGVVPPAPQTAATEEVAEIEDEDEPWQMAAADEVVADEREVEASPENEAGIEAGPGDEVTESAAETIIETITTASDEDDEEDGGWAHVDLKNAGEAEPESPTEGQEAAANVVSLKGRRRKSQKKQAAATVAEELEAVASEADPAGEEVMASETEDDATAFSDFTENTEGEDELEAAAAEMETEADAATDLESVEAQGLGDEDIEEDIDEDEPVEFVEADQVISILESLFFASDRPVSLATIKAIFKGTNVRTKDITRALDLLATEYAGFQRGVTLEEINGGYQLRTKVDNAEFLKRLAKTRPFKLSGPALETLAIIAYKQPLVKSEVDEIRGVESGHLVRALMEKGLVNFAGKSELPGKPMQYGTTRKFLEIFGLRNLKELPTLSEIDALLPEGIGEQEEDKPVLADITDELSERVKETYSEGEEELMKITDQLNLISTSSEFFEQEKQRERDRRDAERARDIREAFALGDSVEDKDIKWLERYENRLAQQATERAAAEAAAALQAAGAENNEVVSASGAIETDAELDSELETELQSAEDVEGLFEEVNVAAEGEITGGEDFIAGDEEIVEGTIETAPEGFDEDLADSTLAESEDIEGEVYTDFDKNDGSDDEDLNH